MREGWHRTGSRIFLALMLLGWLPLAAQDEQAELGWSETAELSWVVTSGNANSSTIGFKSTTARRWDRARFQLKLEGIRAETTNKTRVAVGTGQTNFQVVENSRDELTAEAYFVEPRYDRKITDRFFWAAGASWYRNRPSGIDNRYIGFGSVGNIWVDTDRTSFTTDYGLTYTRQEDVVKNPTINENFAGGRVSWLFKHGFGKDQNTTYGNDTVIDLNFDLTEDWRVNMTNWVAVTMTNTLALKVSLQWLYDNEPSFEAIPLQGSTPPSTVFAQLEELDTIFTTSLVVAF